MPLGKYLCDYCEKEFQDIPTYEETPSSKRPTPSSQSSMVRLLQRSQPCLPRELDQRGRNRFVNTGSCSYGDSCKYLDPNNILQDTVLIVTNQSSTFQENQSVGGSSLPDVVVRDHTGTSSSNLPPSLMPPQEGGHPRLPFVGWG